MIDSVSNLETVANMTGGKFCSAKFKLSDCYELAQSDSSQYYLVGYYVNQTTAKPGWRRIRVNVNRPNAEVRSRTSYYFSSKTTDPKKAEREDMDTAILSPTDFTAVPILVRWTGKIPDGAKTLYKFRFKVPGQGITVDASGGNFVSIAFGAFAKTPKGGIAGDFLKELEGKLPDDTAQQIATRGVVYDGEIAIPKGDYTVRFVVRDNLSGRIGTVTVPVDDKNASSN